MSEGDQEKEERSMSERGQEKQGLWAREDKKSKDYEREGTRKVRIMGERERGQEK